VLPWFANRQAALVVMEAYGGAHDWGRELLKLGHDARLLPPKMVRPFVTRNKTDAAGAQASWTASRQPGVRFVPVKSETQQVVLALHRPRAQLMKMRIMQTNELRGLLYEFGIVLSEATARAQGAARCAARGSGKIAGMLIESLDEQISRLNQLEADIGAVERRLSQQLRDMPACQTVAEIPGVGLMTATAIVASTGSPTAFKDAREFAAWIGLVPRQTGTGGRVRQLSIRKRGDVYLQKLLMHGARAIVSSDKAVSWPWLGTAQAQALQRRGGCRCQ
jgi:transposase